VSVVVSGRCQWCQCVSGVSGGVLPVMTGGSGDIDSGTVVTVIVASADSGDCGQW
jgi:hypothetical protein